MMLRRFTTKRNTTSRRRCNGKKISVFIREQFKAVRRLTLDGIFWLEPLNFLHI